MITNDQQLRLLSRSKLLMTMVDLNGEEQGDEGDDAGLIGDVHVSLNEIAEGGRCGAIFVNPPCQLNLSTHSINTPYQPTLLTQPTNKPYQLTLSTHPPPSSRPPPFLPSFLLPSILSINDKYTIKSNAHGGAVGSLQIALRWRHPFRKQRELGPHTLSGMEVSAMIYRTVYMPYQRIILMRPTNSPAHTTILIAIHLISSSSSHTFSHHNHYRVIITPPHHHYHITRWSH